MNTSKNGERTAKTSLRPRRAKNQLDRGLEYAALHKNGKGLKASQMVSRYGENEVTIYKLIRLGEAPKSVHSLIRKGEVPATVVANNIKASMTNSEIIDMVHGLIEEREKSRAELDKLGFKGASSMTLRRTITMAIANLKKSRVLKGESKTVARVLDDIFGSDKKHTVEDIQNAILG